MAGVDAFCEFEVTELMRRHERFVDQALHARVEEHELDDALSSAHAARRHTSGENLQFAELLSLEDRDLSCLPGATRTRMVLGENGWLLFPPVLVCRCYWEAEAEERLLMGLRTEQGQD